MCGMHKIYKYLYKVKEFINYYQKNLDDFNFTLIESDIMRLLKFYWYSKIILIINKSIFFFLRSFYAMFGGAISFTFGINIIFNRIDPPLADYMFFLYDEDHPYFYIFNLIYQFYLMVIIGIGGVAMEGPFILLIMFFRARFNFLHKLLYLLSDRNCKINQLYIINTLIKIHSDVLR